ncbi:phosphotransferase [Sulfurimonas sp. SWIR-19]|uniref:phosphotransferase n=1 Tax=Sulfurimonas sp. SWIR-19 TaxID=2878390 RepID=UPI001CF331FE|nr:phosphotransferase [Sulfurimonas sp. SWIR-19]UCN00435.1 phosphotransferase [Sulfurimonas sp. SWIR-19]
MGVKTELTLKQLCQLFPKYDFKQIIPTTNGIMDTTYIVKNSSDAYILKKYEREMGKKVQTEQALLEHLLTCKLNTPQYLEENKGWYLYTKLQGSMPKTTKLFHIQALARFLAEFHNQSKDFTNARPFLAAYEINKMLGFVKKNHYAYYKKLSCVKNIRQKEEGFIHGDIFKDNTLFHKNNIAVFDFIDGGLGEFAFDTAVALLSFNPKNRQLFTRVFLATYNQKKKRKITPAELQKQRNTAAAFYALLRINHDKKTKRAKEMYNAS